MNMSPLIAVHMTAALGAIAIGPVALWARNASAPRPQLHRAAGYAWVTLMLLTATSAIFIRDYRLPNIGGFTPVHLLIPVVYGTLFRAFRFLAEGNINGHRRAMLRLYIGACVVAGAFTLMPGRYLGNLVFGQWLGLLSASVQIPQQKPLIVEILTHTPVWVWALLAALLIIGLGQTRSRTAGLLRVTALPLGMGVLSLYGTVSAFGTLPVVLLSWLASCVAVAYLVTPFAAPVGTHYDSRTRQFQLPGSWLPMALIMAIFLTKYAVGVSLVCTRN